VAQPKQQTQLVGSLQGTLVERTHGRNTVAIGTTGIGATCPCALICQYLTSFIGMAEFKKPCPVQHLLCSCTQAVAVNVVWGFGGVLGLVPWGLGFYQGPSAPLLSLLLCVCCRTPAAVVATCAVLGGCASLCVAILALTVLLGPGTLTVLARSWLCSLYVVVMLTSIYRL
jgi:hypothetical protein